MHKYFQEMFQYIKHILLHALNDMDQKIYSEKQNKFGLYATYKRKSL